VSRNIRDLIRRMSRENPGWGAPRIDGELLKLGIDIGETSVSKYLVRSRKLVPREGPPLIRAGENSHRRGTSQQAKFHEIATAVSLPRVMALTCLHTKATSPASVRLTVDCRLTVACESIREDADRFAVRRKGQQLNVFPKP
jgi:hypothetical protein